MEFSLNITHLYPDTMNIYGDRGNVIALTRRAQWRGIKVNLNLIKIGDKLNQDSTDIYFFGGGQDQAQSSVAEDLKTKADTIRADIDKGVCALTVCGGYQLFGRFYVDPDGHKSEGIAIFEINTRAGSKRMIGNLLVKSTPLQADIFETYQRFSAETIFEKQQNEGFELPLIGFENHSGQTYLEKGAEALGTVVKGFGNNGEDKTEGVHYKNAFGTYLHGSLLPKNPLFADYLIEKALQRKYPNFKLKPLKNSMEEATFTEAQSRI